MQSSKIENIEILKNYSYEQRLLSLNENSFTQSMKDADVIKKFCFCATNKKSSSNNSNNSTNDDSREIGQRIDIL